MGSCPQTINNYSITVLFNKASSGAEDWGKIKEGISNNLLISLDTTKETDYSLVEGCL